MSQEWPVVALGTLLTDIQPGFASGKHNSEGVGVPHFRPMNVSTDGQIDRTTLKYVASDIGRPDVRLQRGDVLFNNTNSPELVGKTALFDDDDSPAFSNHMTRLRVDSSRLDPAYLALRLHQAWREGWSEEHCNNHVSQASIGRDVLKSFEIEVPPLSVQQEISALSSEADSRRSSALKHLGASQRSLTRFRQAVLAAGCSGRLTSEWRNGRDLLVTAELARTDELDLETPFEVDSIPNSWVLAQVKDIGTVHLGGTPSRKEPTFWGGGIPWVSSGEVANCRISTTRETITEIGLAKSNAKLYPRGTVLIAMIGEGKTRGQSAILDIDACTNQNVAGIFPDSSLVDPEYVWRWALAQYEVTRAVGRGGNQPALNQQKVRALAIPVPSLHEQREIVRRIDQLLGAADRVASKTTSASIKLDTTGRAVLAKAFRGDLVLERSS